MAEQRSRHAEKLPTQAAGACSPADRAPIPPEVVPRDARRQSSSERGAPMRRPRAERMSVSAARRPAG